MQVNPAEIQLSPDQQLFIARQAESSGRPWRELLDSLVPVAESPHGTPSDSAFDAFFAAGFIGAAEGLPQDLSTNPKHLDGFGQ